VSGLLDLEAFAELASAKPSSGMITKLLDIFPF
jgi:hypothetical protein